MNKEIKGLVIIGLILTSIVGSSFAFNMQSSMNNTQSSYYDGVLADTSNIEVVQSKTGALVDICDDNPCDNLVTYYNFTGANNKDLLNILNDNIKKSAENNSDFSNIEIVGFDIKPINSDYFNVTVDENNTVKVVQLQNVGNNEQVMFLSINLILHNKTTGDVANIVISNFLADKNPHIPNVNKEVVNPQVKLFLSDGFCKHACNLLGTMCAGAMAEWEVCAALGIGGIACIAVIGIGYYAVSQGGCPWACSGIPGPW
ncbi:MAG: hypothetical protein LBD03_06690 [Methanobrevibacter sp.]|jgi:hypothetical protein|nr:hypothetical protein [Candidatus Methanovirga procula]